ncbi:hypothetical protein SAMN04489720_1269 [Agrococcus jejuensis]|uniref:Uncharacterized protein n=1 Tax=Agrococcus jejuensis TaxID=399736 RepID=A0A1G8CF35_9MICO|nr:hypothetical protein SAMN04489720_1269 [Agrococcus jejuensis]
MALGIGAAAAVVALLPWMLTGMRLPLQNLWATATLPDDMPFSLWPFNQYLLELVFAIAGFAGAVAAVVGRILRWGARGAWLATAGMAGVLVVALAQSAIVTAGGLDGSRAATLYLVAFSGASLLLIACGATLAVIGVTGRRIAVVAGTFGAIAVGSWLGSVVHPWGVVVLSPVQQVLLLAVTWVPAVLVGALLAWCGLRARDAAAWVVSLVVLAVLPAAIVAVGTAIGYRVYWTMPGELVAIAGETFVRGLTTDAALLAVPSVAIALVIGLLGVGARAWARRRSASAPSAQQ